LLGAARAFWFLVFRHGFFGFDFAVRGLWGRERLLMVNEGYVRAGRGKILHIQRISREKFVIFPEILLDN